MEQRGARFSRIRCPRGSDPRAFTAQAHRAAFLIAYGEPSYPAEARDGGIEGRVVIDIVVSRTGEIQSLSVRSGHPLLAEAALEGVRHWTYRPTKVNGTPVEVATDIEVTFTLPDSVVSS